MQDKPQTQYLLTPRSKWKMHHLYERSQNRNVQIFGYVYQDTNGLNHGPAWKIQSFHSSERQFEKVLLENGWEEVPNWECLLVNREKGLFLSVYVDGIKISGKKQNLDPMWKIHMKDIDLGEPTSFLDHVYLGCTQRQCDISKDIVENYRDLFESRMSAGDKDKLRYAEKSEAVQQSVTCRLIKTQGLRDVHAMCH